MNNQYAVIRLTGVQQNSGAVELFEQVLTWAKTNFPRSPFEGDMFIPDEEENWTLFIRTKNMIPVLVADDLDIQKKFAPLFDLINREFTVAFFLDTGTHIVQIKGACV